MLIICSSWPILSRDENPGDNEVAEDHHPRQERLIVGWKIISSNYVASQPKVETNLCKEYISNFFMPCFILVPCNIHSMCRIEYESEHLCMYGAVISLLVC